MIEPLTDLRLEVRHRLRHARQLLAFAGYLDARFANDHGIAGNHIEPYSPSVGFVAREMWSDLRVVVAERLERELDLLLRVAVCGLQLTRGDVALLILIERKRGSNRFTLLLGHAIDFDLDACGVGGGGREQQQYRQRERAHARRLIRR